jgi:dTDP-4-amino-4,6-dideoxygalactose transaminase
MIPFVDLRAQYRSIKPEIDAAIFEVLDSGSFILGPAVNRFEARFAAYVGTRHALGVNSGTSALHLALLAAGVGPGDEVIAPAMTFVATVAAITYTGARPVLVDIDPATYTIDPTRIEAAITPRTKAIMPVHLYGQCADMAPILDIAKRHGLLVIEDAAQAHGAEYWGRMAGSMGDLAGFSFYPTKNLGACGEGGAVTTARDDLARTVRMLRDWGSEKKHEHLLKGFNFRMEGIQGAILGAKLARLEGWTEGRRRAAASYREQLAGLEGVILPAERTEGRHVYSVFAILVQRRDEVVRRFQEAGIGFGIHYPRPVHLLPCFADLGYKTGDFPVAERVAAMELSLPMFPELTAGQIGEVAAVLAEGHGR